MSIRVCKTCGVHKPLSDYACHIPKFPARVAAAVVCLTRYPCHTPAAYYASIRANPLALRVKLADIADNADPERLALLDEATANRLRAKYAKALEQLTHD